MNLIFRKAGLNDARFVYDLRFLLCDQNSYFTVKDIDFKRHCVFWEKHYKTYTIALQDDKKVGFYGFVDNDFRYAVIPEARGRGIGLELISHAIKIDKLCEAKVLKSNLPSLKCFNKAGFRIKDDAVEKGQEYVILRLK
tara:strand:+ start:120 stop:536 length:417 start_codon:yes stop_codon:yes gene_type:complete